MTTRPDSYAAFLAQDRRRRGNALELGHGWAAEGRHWRVCWYEETGELTVEDLDDAAGIDVGDFHFGVCGPVRVLGVISSRRRLETLVGRWPGTDRWRPRTVERLCELISA